MCIRDRNKLNTVLFGSPSFLLMWWIILPFKSVIKSPLRMVPKARCRFSIAVKLKTLALNICAGKLIGKDDILPSENWKIPFSLVMIKSEFWIWWTPAISKISLSGYEKSNRSLEPSNSKKASCKSAKYTFPSALKLLINLVGTGILEIFPWLET